MLDPLYSVISFILLLFHDIFSLVLDPDAGITWTLSIIFLVITIRALLFPLFVKQIKSQRRMQLIQPELKEIREKYKGDREKLNQEMSRLMSENNANPIMGCLPLLVQIPVFFSLFHVLRYVKPGAEPLYGWTEAQVESAAFAKLLGAPISLAFTATQEQLTELDANQLNVRLVTGTFIVMMAVTMFLTQRQMFARQKGMADTQGPNVQNVQKILMYVIPVTLLVSGPFFPLGVLIYWTATNLFSMGQQQYVIRGMNAHEEEKRQREIDRKQNPTVQGPRPGVKPANPRKGGQSGPASASGSGAASKPARSGSGAGSDKAGGGGTGSSSAAGASQGKSSQGKSSQAKSSQGKPPQGKTSQGKTTGGSGSGASGGDARSSQSGGGSSKGKGRKR